MAELLIKAVDSPISGGYKRGDVVIVCPDDCPWGKEEVAAPVSGGLFCIAKVSGSSVDSLVHFCKPEISQSFHNALNDTISTVVTCREWRLDVDELSGDVTASLDFSGSASISTGSLLPAMERKVDGVRGDEI